MIKIFKIFKILIIVSIVTMILVFILDGHHFPNILFLKIISEAILIFGLVYIPILNTILFIIILCSGFWDSNNFNLLKVHKIVLYYVLYFLAVCVYYGYNIFFVEGTI